jgi:hypothetical protein
MSGENAQPCFRWGTAISREVTDYARRKDPHPAAIDRVNSL